MNDIKRHRSSVPLGSRAASLLLAGSAALAVVSVTAPARAQSAMALAFAKAAASGVISSAAGDGMGYVYPTQTQTTNLSSESLASIESAVSSLLSAQSVSDATAYADAILEKTTTYYRGTTCDDLATSLATVQNTILWNAGLLDGKLRTCGYACASLYGSMGSVYVAFEKENYEILYEQNQLGCATHDAATLATALNAYQSTAEGVLSHMKYFGTLFAAQWPSSAAWKSATTKVQTGSNCDEYRTGYANYCLTYTPNGGSSTTLCPTTDLSASTEPAGTKASNAFAVSGCVNTLTGGVSTWHYDSTQNTDSQANGNIFLKNMKASYRDAQLGADFFEIESALQKIANTDFNYAGDGICSIGEAGKAKNSSSSSVFWTADCSSSSFASKSFNLSSNTSYYASSGSTQILTFGGLTLAFGSDGNLTLKNSSSTTLWQTGTSGTGNRFTLQTDGNMCVYGSTGTLLWQSATSYNKSIVSPAVPQTLVLMADGLHLMDDRWHQWWSSSTDWNHYADLESQMKGDAAPGEATDSAASWVSTSTRQCWTKGAQTVLLSGNSFNLVWESDGALNVYEISTGSTKWASGTSGTGNYLCNEETGNLTIYDAAGTQKWSTNTGTGTGAYDWSGVGGDIVLAGDQVRLIAASGEPLWVSQTCNGSQSWSCSQDGAYGSAQLSSTWKYRSTGSGTKSIHYNDYAELLYLPSGYLALYDKTPVAYGGSKVLIWESSVAGAEMIQETDKVVLTSATNFAAPLWSTGTSDTNGYFMLAGCNMYVANGSTGQADYSTHTGCRYDTTSTNLVASVAP